MRIFVSHTSADKAVVRRIAAGLEDAGLLVWLDEARIRVGESIPEAISKGLNSSDLLLLAFSRESLGSPWVSRELNSFFMQAMHSGKPVVPCRLDDSAPPTLLADLKYADFRTSFDDGMAALLGAVGVAEELAEMRAEMRAAEAEMRATEVAREELERGMSREDREVCYRAFILRDGYELSAYQWMRTSEREAQALDKLTKHGLLRSENNATDGWWFKATSRGMRVMGQWGPVLDS